MVNQNSSAIDVEEHDNQFGVRKVSPFLDDGEGNLVREAIQGLNVGRYDYLAFGYDGSGNLTSITYYFGGPTGQIIATLTLAYDGSNNLLSVTKT